MDGGCEDVQRRLLCQPQQDGHRSCTSYSCPP
jgi:hypothetical protein